MTASARPATETVIARGSNAFSVEAAVGMAVGGVAFGAIGLALGIWFFRRRGRVKGTPACSKEVDQVSGVFCNFDFISDKARY